ncbi:MAG: efflux RND transporter periplasmic adaptor subunit [Desulforhopalus sp.]
MKVKQWECLFIVIVFVVLLAGCDKNEPAIHNQFPSLAPIAVSVGQVTKRIAANQVEVVGTLQAVERAVISSKISGNIITLQVDLGSKVKKGELLIELSAGEISARVQQAKAQLEQAKRNLAREESLLKKNAATAQTVKSLRDSNRIAEAAYNEAVTMLDYTRITAPFSGIITKKLANVGDLAIPGRPLLHLEEGNNLQVVTHIPEAMILGIQKNDRLPIFIPAINLSFEGIVAEVSPVADPASRSAPIKLHISPDPRLRSGLFARVSLTGEQAETLTIPSSAIVSFGQMERVYVIHEDKARLRLVQTGTLQNGEIEILSGLTEGEMVVKEADSSFHDGQPIFIK